MLEGEKRLRELQEANSKHLKFTTITMNKGQAKRPEGSYPKGTKKRKENEAYAVESSSVNKRP